MTGQPEFGQRLQTLRLAAGIKLSSAAAALGIHHDHLARIENGLEKPPSNRLLDEISRLYHVDRDTLYVAAERIPPELYRAAATAEGIAFLRTFVWRRNGSQP